MMTLEEIAELQEQLDGETALTARDLEALICNLRIEQARLERLLREQRKVEDTTVLDRPSDQTLDLAHRVRIYIDVCLNRQRKAEKFKETTKAWARRLTEEDTGHQLDFAQIKGVYAVRALADLIERAESDPSITDADIDRARWTDKTWTITEHVLRCRLIEFDEARGIYR
jgi:hypothetical protein